MKFKMKSENKVVNYCESLYSARVEGEENE